MNSLSTYLKAEKIVKEKEVKEAIALIPKIVLVCLRKGLSFSLNTDAEVININDFENYYSLTAYYNEDLIFYQSDFCTTVKDIYEKVKEYKKCK